MSVTLRLAAGRSWPIRVYFVGLFALGLVAAVSAAVYVDRQAGRDARAAASLDARFSAAVAAEQLGEHVELLRKTTAGLAANPQIEQILATPEGCTLTFQGLAPGDGSHLDLLRADGTVACSSVDLTPAATGRGYGESGWFARALEKPQLVAPALDDVYGGQMAISTTPIAGGQGVVAAFLDLTPVARELEARYGGGRRTVFLLTGAEGRTVVSRSLESTRWAGAELSEAQQRTLGRSERLGLDGVERLYASASVPGVDWRLHVGERKSAVLAAVGRLRARQLEMILLGLAVFLLATAIVYRRVVTPIRRLSAAVQSTDPLDPAAAVPVSGPAEVTTLGEDVNSLIGSVQEGLRERQEAEASYRLLFEGNPAPMWVYERESLRFLAVNEAAVEGYGWSREEFLAMTIEDIRPDTELSHLHSDLAENEGVGPSGFRHAGIWQHRRKDGTLREVEISSHDHMFEGRAARVVLALDVTDRVQAEQALRRSEARYRALFENASDLISTADLDGRLTSVNDAFVRATGYGREELVGMPLAELVPEQQRPQLRDALERKLAGDEATLYEHELLARDGRRIHVEVSSRLITEEGRPVGTEAIGRDISERVQLEEQLRQAQRLEAVGRLAGGVAHDFNNVLTVIGGYTEALLAQAENGQEELEEIAAAAQRAATLTRQLLAFSRQQILEPRPLVVNDVVEGLAPMLRRLIGEDIELLTTLTPNLEPVLADAGQLEQVLVNLVVNARDAMPEGGRLTIQTANVELDEAYVAHHGDTTVGPHVLLSVGDEGTGMNADTLAHAFDPFYTTKPVGSGTGLGLATVYGIVKQSGGTIWVYSEPDEGTTIKIYLPTTDAPVTKPQTETAPAAAPHGSETILVAEDEESLRTLTARMLAQRGYEVITAETATDALAILEREPERIDLLLTDLVMPELSGRALAERVTALAPQIRVLFMSGYSDDTVTRSGNLEPGAAFLEKPFTSNQLATKVRETLSTTS